MIQEKYDRLPVEAQRHIAALIDLLLQQNVSTPPSTEPANWKANLQKVSVWTEEEINTFEENHV